jgi:hypothetical protein
VGDDVSCVADCSEYSVCEDGTGGSPRVGRFAFGWRALSFAWDWGRVVGYCHVCVGAVAVGAVGVADVVEVGADDREGCVA